MRPFLRSHARLFSSKATIVLHRVPGYTILRRKAACHLEHISLGHRGRYLFHDLTLSASPPPAFPPRPYLHICTKPTIASPTMAQPQAHPTQPQANPTQPQANPTYGIRHFNSMVMMVAISVARRVMTPQDDWRYGLKNVVRVTLAIELYVSFAEASASLLHRLIFYLGLANSFPALSDSRTPIPMFAGILWWNPVLNLRMRCLLRLKTWYEEALCIKASLQLY